MAGQQLYAKKICGHSLKNLEYNSMDGSLPGKLRQFWALEQQKNILLSALALQRGEQRHARNRPRGGSTPDHWPRRGAKPLCAAGTARPRLDARGRKDNPAGSPRLEKTPHGKKPRLDARGRKAPGRLPQKDFVLLQPYSSIRSSAKRRSTHCCTRRCMSPVCESSRRSPAAATKLTT